MPGQKLPVRYGGEIGHETYLEHFVCLRPTNGNLLGLLEQIVKVLLLVEVSDQLRLEVVLDKVDQKVHDRLRNRVLDVLANDQKVGPNQSLDHLTIVLLLRCQLANVSGVGLRQKTRR